MKHEIIGRHVESTILASAIASDKAELGIIYGRRRVGKSTLLQSLLRKNDLCFEGVKGLSTVRQIRHFCNQLAEQTSTVPVAARDWSDALRALTPHINTRKRYVIIDELPWMAQQSTELVSFLKYYWDNHWKVNPKLTLILCGSIANFMVKHVVHSEALHNRKTFEFKLGPLSMKEARAFFPKAPVDHILKYLIVFGGIPKYLEQIDSKESFMTNVDRLCFRKTGFFVNEFETIFKEQFRVSRIYEKTVAALSGRSLNLEMLSKKLKMTSGGGLHSYIEHLELADFVKTFKSFGFDMGEKGRTSRIYLWDEWLNFYFMLMKPNLSKIQINDNPGLFEAVSSKRLPIYFGFGFERLIIKNISLLLEKLEIQLANILNFGPFFRQTARKGTKHLEPVQVDLLIEEKDQTLTIIECKYQLEPISLSIIHEIEEKIRRIHIPARYFVRKVLISGGPVSKEVQRKGYFAKILTAEELLA